jgi:transcriptional regulator with XRE-family HTH domain
MIRGGAMTIAQQLKKLRIRKNMSLQDVADAVKASKAHIWDLEAGRALNPSMDLLRRLADFYEVRVADLVGEIPKEGEDDPALIALFRGLKDLEPGDRETIRVLMERLKDRSR